MRLQNMSSNLLFASRLKRSFEPGNPWPHLHLISYGRSWTRSFLSTPSLSSFPTAFPPILIFHSPTFPPLMRTDWRDPSDTPRLSAATGGQIHGGQKEDR